MENNKTYILNNGVKCPIMGLGTSEIKNIIDVVYSSIKDGVRLIDTASFYKNEVEVGKGIKKALDEKIVNRCDGFIITKCWVDERDDPEAAGKRSLERLQGTYIDLYLDHWPLFINYNSKGEHVKNIPMHLTWAKFESCIEKGGAKTIGVSNYNVQSLLNLLSFCKIKPQFQEIEYHPYLTQENLKNGFDKENIRVIAYNSLVKGTYAFKTQKEQKGNGNLLEEDAIKDAAKKYVKTPGQIALNWSISQGVIVIPGTSNVNRMKENLIAGNFIMDKEDIEKIGKLNKNLRFCPTPPVEAFGPLEMFS